MRHQNYRTRAMRAQDPRFARVFDALGYERRDMRARMSEEDRTELKALRDVYTSRAGKRPFNGWDLATLQQKIDALGD